MLAQRRVPTLGQLWANLHCCLYIVHLCRIQYVEVWTIWLTFCIWNEMRFIYIYIYILLIGLLSQWRHMSVMSQNTGDLTAWSTLCSLFTLTIKKTLKLVLQALCEGNTAVSDILGLDKIFHHNGNLTVWSYSTQKHSHFKYGYSVQQKLIKI